MTQLEISLLGTMHVTRDGAEVTGFQGDAARALLAYLVTHRERPIARETLAGLLWPEWPDAEALHNLRSTLYRLREALGDHEANPPYFEITRHTLRISPDCHYALDVQAFTAAIAAVQMHDHDTLLGCPACLLRLTEAASLYYGDFMDGFSLDSAALEGWLVVEREALHQQALWVLEELADSHEAQGAYQQALAYARRQIALEPWCERAHRQVMRILALSDHRTGAIAQFEACRRALREALGIEPELRTRELCERIRAGTLQPLPEPVRLVLAPPSLTPAPRARDASVPSYIICVIPGTIGALTPGAEHTHWMMTASRP